MKPPTLLPPSKKCGNGIVSRQITQLLPHVIKTNNFLLCYCLIKMGIKTSNNYFSSGNSGHQPCYVSWHLVVVLSSPVTMTEGFVELGIYHLGVPSAPPGQLRRGASRRVGVQSAKGVSNHSKYGRKKTFFSIEYREFFRMKSSASHLELYPFERKKQYT